MITVAIANQKGGTGKTTTAVTMGHGLARYDYKVLLVDTDPQGHVSTALGFNKEPGIYTLVEWYRSQNTEPLIVSARPNLDLIPSNKQTTEAKETLTGMRFREDFLERSLAELSPDYDIAVIDCAPSVDVLHMAALVASDWLVVPTRLDYLAVDGVNEVILLLKDTKQFRPQAADLLGILPTFFDRRTNETLEQMEVLVDTFGDLVLPPIPVDVKLREAPAFGQSIWEYAPSSRSVKGVKDGDQIYGGYARFVKQMEERLWQDEGKR